MIKILTILDDKKSSLNQCEALLENITEDFNVKVTKKIIKKKWVNYLPNTMIYFYLLFINYFRRPDKVNFDLIISVGRVCAPYNLIEKRINKSKSIHILDPYIFREMFDLIIIPSHDSLKLKKLNNVVSTLGTLVKKQSLVRIKEKNLKGIENSNLLTCLVGGNGKSSYISNFEMKGLVKLINKIDKKIKVVYCFSRRTSEEVKRIINKDKQSNHLVLDYKEPNPYWSLMQMSSYFIVTSDSVSMISDAISTGRPVYIYEIKKIKKKIKEFSEILIKKKIIRIFKGKIEKWVYLRVDNFSKIIKIIKNFF
ncbi:MAG: ELM1/GtrOC1 family putative glycosyltransferase [Alphaproteobacteria bacterium]